MATYSGNDNGKNNKDVIEVLILFTFTFLWCILYQGSEEIITKVICMTAILYGTVSIIKIIIDKNR
jgi:hypothetical protein